MDERENGLDDEKTNILQQFKINMSDLLQPHHDDRFLLRWLRARDFSLREAEKMLREDFKMRKKAKIGNILDYEVPEVVKSYIPTAFLGFSKHGHPVRFCHVGKIDAKGLAKSLSFQDTVLSTMHILEGDKHELEQRNRETGNSVETSVYIADYSELRLTQWCSREVIRFATVVTQKYQDHYPETMHRFFGLNVPSYILNIINIILRPFFAENVWLKLRMFSAGDERYKEELFSLVPKEIVPAYLGGERYEPEGDPTCDGLVHRKEKIPPYLYLKDQMTLKSDDLQVQQKIIRERSVFEIEKQITACGVILCWEFQTKEHNIKFGLFYKKPQKNCDKNAVEELVPVESTECNVMCEQGEYVCQKEGTYILHFDNKYSWMRSKHLFYKVEVQQPDTPIEE